MVGEKQNKAENSVEMEAILGKPIVLNPISYGVKEDFQSY